MAFITLTSFIIAGLFRALGLFPGMKFAGGLFSFIFGVFGIIAGILWSLKIVIGF